jgi:hypothetical protein
MDDISLANLLKADTPPAQDMRFSLAVMTRIEQRQFRRNLLRHVLVGGAATLVLALVAPTLNLVWGDIAAPLSNNMIIAALLLAAAVVALPLIAQRD